MKTKHTHVYRRGRSSVDVCICGRFRHNEKAGPAIVVQPPPPKHTPGKLAYRKHTRGDHYVIYAESPHAYICDCEFEDDARELVRRWNVHSEMLEALERAGASINAAWCLSGTEMHAQRFHDDLRVIRAAIAQAEGKE